MNSHYFMLQITKYDSNTRFSGARHWLYSFPWDWAGTSLISLWTFWKLSLDNPSLSSPPEITTAAVATVGSHCSYLTLKALVCQASLSHLQFLIRLCLFITLNACWRFLAPELSGQELFLMLLYRQSCSVSQLSRTEDIISYTTWNAINFGFIF